MNVFDLAPLSRSTIGFDRLLNLIENASTAEVDAYPPYNIARTGEDTYRITLAVAGFAPEELSITTQPNQLVVSGRKSLSAVGEYLHQGIAARAFTRQFSLADWVRVADASLQNGLLSIDLTREVPEAAKPRRIEIATVASKQPEQLKAA